MGTEGRIPTVEPAKVPIYGLELWDLTSEYAAPGVPLDPSVPEKREVLEVLAAMPLDARLDWRMTRAAAERALFAEAFIAELTKDDAGDPAIAPIQAITAADAGVGYGCFDDPHLNHRMPWMRLDLIDVSTWDQRGLRRLRWMALRA